MSHLASESELIFCFFFNFPPQVIEPTLFLLMLLVWLDTWNEVNSAPSVKGVEIVTSAFGKMHFKLLSCGDSHASSSASSSPLRLLSFALPVDVRRLPPPMTTLPVGRRSPLFFGVAGCQIDADHEENQAYKNTWKKCFNECAVNTNDKGNFCQTQKVILDLLYQKSWKNSK